MITYTDEPPWRLSRRQRRKQQLETRAKQRPAIAEELRKRGHARRAADLASCRTKRILVDPMFPTEARFGASSCNHRACASCYERDRLQQLLALLPAIYFALGRDAVATFATFTIRRAPGSRPSAVRRELQAALARLRRRSFYRGAIWGAIVRYEGHGTVDAGPHEHIHVLLIGTRLDVTHLRTAWRRVARTEQAGVEAWVVPKREIRCVLAYMAKPLETQPAEIVERALAFRGKHDISVSGELSPVKNGAAPIAKVERARTRRCVALPPDELAAMAASGVPWAQVALKALGRFQS